jgi:phage N-6-adenine-methyltransferase
MKVDAAKLAYIGSAPGNKTEQVRDPDSWFTPSIYTEMARQVMGEIDLDPFSSAAANQRVKAKRFFDKQIDAFKSEWFSEQGRVFMNPPYTRKLIDAAVDLFIANFEREAITQGIVLVNNATETKWFHALLKHCSALCLPDRRIAFENDDGKHVSGNTRGQVFFYFGHRPERFKDVFEKSGVVMCHFR